MNLLCDGIKEGSKEDLDSKVGEIVSKPQLLVFSDNPPEGVVFLNIKDDSGKRREILILDGEAFSFCRAAKLKVGSHIRVMGVSLPDKATFGRMYLNNQGFVELLDS